jgi:predicted ATPase
MPLTELRVAGYRSLRSVELPLGPLNVITGPNGSGKSNLYRVLWLLAQVSEGSFAQALAREGGLLSAFWAGPPRNTKPKRMEFGFTTDEFSYQLSCGFPTSRVPGSRFCFDADIKEETIWFGPRLKPTTTLLHRKGGMTQVRDADGRRVEYPLTLSENESVLAQLREPHRFPELFLIRDAVRAWRFYHAFRTDADAPLRFPQISVLTPVLSDDGYDLAASLQTILEMGDHDRLHAAIEEALPGRTLVIHDSNDEGQPGITPRSMELLVALETKGCTRDLLARELSDGTLKFLCLAAALLSPRPPSLIALNEPESSLHPDVLPALARLIVDASRHSQLWVTTHSSTLANHIQRLSDVAPVVLELVEGETQIVGGPA